MKYSEPGTLVGQLANKFWNDYEHQITVGGFLPDNAQETLLLEKLERQGRYLKTWITI